MKYDELAVKFVCEHQDMFGILSVPDQPGPRAVLIVVGGPQYRAGSHRQFTLLARSLAEQGIAVLRFDYRGMGDSEGEARSFDDVDSDLGCAVDHLLAAVPQARDVVIWGLCDAASAALFYAGGDTRVCGLVLLNPWARSTDGHARATLKHYYRQRLLEPAFWRKLLRGRLNVAAAGASFARLLGAARVKAPAPAAGLHQRMLAGALRFKGSVLLIISGADLTAREFMDMADGSAAWRGWLASDRVSRRDLPAADHTFSRRAWRDQVARWTAEWVHAW
jgi:exosortase A-associated hydrolase 1